MGSSKKKCVTSLNYNDAKLGCKIEVQTKDNECVTKCYCTPDNQTVQFTFAYVVSNKCLLVRNSYYNVGAVVSNNEGFPDAIWDLTTHAPFSTYSVPYLLKNSDGGITSTDYMQVNQIYGGKSLQTTAANPTLGETTTKGVVADNNNLFVPNVVPLFPISASDQDVDGSESKFLYSGIGFKVALSVAAVDMTVNGTTTKVTKVTKAEEVINECTKVPLYFKTYKLYPLGSESVTENPVFFTFVRTATSCQYIMGVYHSVAAADAPGTIVPSESTSNLVIPQYELVVAKSNDCNESSEDNLTNVFANHLSDTIYALETGTNSNPTTKVLLDGPAAYPGGLDAGQKVTLVNLYSQSLINAWGQSVLDFNAELAAVSPP